MQSKTTLKKIAVICSLFMLTGLCINAQTTCGTAVSYSYPITQTVSSYTNDVYWFSVTLGVGDYQIAIKSASSTNKIRSANVYTGTCSSYTLVGVDSLFNTTTDSSFFINLTNTVSTTYNIELARNGSAVTFTTSTSAFLSIVGDIGFCPGVSSITLATNTLSMGTGTVTPSYTWQPGGATTSSISITSPTVGATYTLSYIDPSGTTYTTSVTTFTLPASACNSCNLVQNGSFESYQHQRNNATNIYTRSCPNYSPISDPKYWISPTCGSPDYFNANFPVSSRVGVPINGPSGSSSTYPHTGNGYAGFFTCNPGDREYIQEPLKCALVAGQLYNISFYTVSAFNTYENNIGAYLSTSTISATGSPVLNYTPQINASSIITNTGSAWVQVSGTYIGNGEQYITIGNFYGDANNLFSSISPSSAYYFVDDISVTPVTPTITASGIHSGTVTLTAYGAASANTTWSGPNSFTASGNPISIPTPTAAATYTCTVSFGCSGCSAITETITVQPPTPCSGANPVYSPTVAYTFTATPGYAASAITVTTGVLYTISNAELRMASTASITVVNGGTLTISNSWLHVCNENSGNMWPGIIVQNGGTLLISDCIIEDAIHAVYTASNTAATPIPTYSINTSIFNNNATGIYIDTHQGNLSGNSVNTTIFTCRNLGNHTATLTNITNIGNDITSATPLIPSTANPTDLTIAGLRSAYGIYINAVNVAYPINVFGGYGAEYYCLRCGTYGFETAFNVFDNMDYGIYAYESSLIAQSNTFQNLTGNNSSSTPIGVGIYSDVTTPGGRCTGPCTVAGVLTVGSPSTTIASNQANFFTNCLIGVYTKRMKQVYINFNFFNNETTATTFTTSGSYVTGQYGVYNYAFAANSSVTIPEEMIFANNTIQNCATGVFMDCNLLNNALSGYTNGPGCSAYIYNNAISGGGYSNQYCGTGLYLQQSSYPGANASVPQDAIYINANPITSISNYALNVNAFSNASGATSGVITASQNTLTVNYNATATVSVAPPLVAAVNISGSEYIKVSNNPVVGTTLTSYPSTNAQYIEGIYVSASPGSRITCNAVSGVGEGFVWYNNSQNSKWLENTMDHSQYGLVLRNSGIMGNQGTPGHSGYYCGDQFSNSHISIAQTLSDGSNPGLTGSTSFIYNLAPTCTATTTYIPCTNTLVSGTGAYAYTASGSTVTLATVTGVNGYTYCTSQGGTGRMMAPGKDDERNGSNDIDGAPSDSVLQSYLVNNGSLPVYDFETRWATQYYVNKLNPNIAANTAYANAKAFAIVDAAIKNENYVNAKSLNNAVSAANIIEHNWQQVNNTILKLQGDTLNAGDIKALQSIAAQCPLSGGSIVYRARAILNAHFNTIINYPDKCANNNAGTNSRTESMGEIAANTNPMQTVNLYPNPNNGSFIISYTGAGKQLMVEAYNIMGQQVLTQQYPITNTNNIPVTGLSEGVYFVKINVDNIPVKTEKIIVTK